MLKIKEFTTEYQDKPLGIDAEAPRFSWKLHSTKKSVMQKTFRICVRTAEETVWDSGEVESDHSICVRYAGDTLKDRTMYQVYLTVWDNYGESAGYESYFETGLLTYKNMKADWITHGFEDNLEPCAVFTKIFSASKPLQKARLYASALGVYEFEINGKAGSDVHLAPGWTSYREIVQYQTYDITHLIEPENEIRFTVGNGWYKGILGFFNQGNHYGTRTALIAQIELTYEDGIKEVIATDGAWKSTTGVHRYSEWYHGEVIDYTIDEQEIRSAQRYDYPKHVLLAQQDEPVRITERVSGKRMVITPNGEKVIDFEQNLAGIVEVHIQSEKGTRVIIRHAEALDEKGNFYTANLRTAKATDTFICSGEEDVFRPKFTSHGFRYIAVEGLEGELVPENFIACVWHTDLKQTGQFICSNEAVNRLWKNINWTMRSNYIDVPTDCPQRDERLGYTGDAQLFLSTAVCFKQVPLFFEKWLKDLKYEQKKGQGIPTSVPNVIGDGGGIAIWHDAGTVVPWTLYETYGDISILEEQFESMVSCVEYSRNIAGDDGLIKTGQQLGDWVALDVARGPMNRWKAKVWNLELGEKIGATDPFFAANVYYANSVRIVSDAARILGKEKEAEEYSKLYEVVIRAIRREYITRTGRLVSETQSGCALALHFGITEEKDREKMRNTLVEKLKERKNHLTTGFAGTRILCKVLSENGAHDVAGSVFLKEDCPSWLYSVKLGATTVWELWDGVNEDGSFNPFEMNSLNQCAYASIGDWIFRNLCGLDYLEPGYKRSIIAPRLVKGIPEISASQETVYGTLSCKVTCRDNRYTIELQIPENTTALVSLPERKAEELGSGSYYFEYATEDVFEKMPYDMDTKFGVLLKNPVAKTLLNQYAKDLMENQMFLMFAIERPLIELTKMLPEEAMQLINMVLAQCNAAEKERTKK